MPFVILPTNSSSGGYDITNSLRFNSGSTDKLTRTTGTPTSQQKFTWSAWCKRSNIGTFNIIQGFYTDVNNYLQVSFLTTDRLDILNYAGATTARKITTAKFRDVSAWYHVVGSVDTTLATADDRIKIYVNGVLQTVFDFNTTPSQNANLLTNATTTAIGVGEVSEGYFNGYISEIYYIDGQALTPSSFGETDEDTGIWKPKAFSGSYGTNGYYLQFKNSASLGTDSSGNGNTFTVNNLTSIDQTTDTPTNNFATINALENSYSSFTLTEGNLKAVTSNYSSLRSTIGVSSGKWYMEVKCTAQTGSTNKWSIGIADIPNSSSTKCLGQDNYSYSWRGEASVIYYNNTSASYGSSTMATGDIIGIALDLDNNKLYWSKNGTFINSANPATNTNGFSITGASSTNTGFYHFAFGECDGDTNFTFETNFGNPPYSANSYTDDAGYGNFSYAVPSGYYALNTKNLAQFG